VGEIELNSAVPTFLADGGVGIGDRGPANTLTAIMLISSGKQCTLAVFVRGSDVQAAFHSTLT
jgi:hypothetical protein